MKKEAGTGKRRDRRQVLALFGEALMTYALEIQRKPAGHAHEPEPRTVRQVLRMVKTA